MSTTERTEWNTEQLQEDFEVIGFLAPYVPCETHDGPCDRYCGHGAEPRTAAGSLD
jgi:hypothetical protein